MPSEIISLRHQLPNKASDRAIDVYVAAEYNERFSRLSGAEQ